MFNLLRDQWLPVRRQKSGACVIRPAQLTEALEHDPVVAIDWPRADFRIASLEFLIGLLATAIPPADHDAWLEHWNVPPTPEALQATFAPLAHAFALDGDGPRFLQDAEDLVADREPVERLLIEAPGDSTIKHNTDLLVRRGRVRSLGRAAAAMALYTFQSWAPEGGRGNFTGLRGGGPMVTLALPHTAKSLWHVLWANVPLGSPPASSGLPRVFPWLAPAAASKTIKVVTPTSAHRLQCWWGMPRRIRLDFEAAEPATPCDLTGVPDSTHVVGWRQRPGVSKYTAWAGVHPLTPTRQEKPMTEILAVHPQPGGIGYQQWLGLVLEAREGTHKPAGAISSWRLRYTDAGCGNEGDRSRLLAAGFDMKSMKARAFIETEMPLPALVDPAAQERLDALASHLVKAAELVASLLRGGVRAALFSAGATVKLDSELLSSLREQFWEQTEATFFALLHDAGRRGAAEPCPEYPAWHATLRDVALRLFDEAAPLEADSGGSAAPRIGRARRGLVFALLGYGRDGSALFTELDLPAPEQKPRKGKAG